MVPSVAPQRRVAHVVKADQARLSRIWEIRVKR